MISLGNKKGLIMTIEIVYIPSKDAVWVKRGYEDDDYENSVSNAMQDE